MGLFSKIKNKFSKIALSFSLLFGALSGAVSVSSVGYAASGEAVSGSLSDPKIGLSYERSGGIASKGTTSWTASGTTIEGSVKGHKEFLVPYSEKSTLTIQNLYNVYATISYTVSEAKDNGGSHNISVPSGTDLSPNGTCQVTLESKKGENTTSIKLTNVSLTPIYKTTTFKTSEGGTYSANNEPIVSETVKNNSDSYQLFATPSASYVFVGWRVNGAIVSSNNPYSYAASSDATVSPVFSNSSLAMFSVGGIRFSNLNEAISTAANAANGSDKNIVVASSGSVPAGNYTIPDGVTLYVPNDETSFADYKQEAGSYSETSSTPVLYRSLRLQNGCKITCKGTSSIVVCCKIYANSNGVMSNPVGPYGEIKMDIGSKITLEYGSSLYAWGFISGSDDFVDPAIEAMSGSKIYEMFQIMTWRGGTASTSMVNNKEKVFLFNQYYVQNIEVPLKLNAGAIERGTVAVKVSKLFRQISFIFIGGSNEGMFRLDEGASIVKRYHKGTDKDSDADRLQFYLNGNGSLKNIEFTVDGLLGVIGNVEIKSQNYILPIGSNFDIYVESGTTTIGQGIAVLPDANITVSKGAAVNVSADTYLYNLADWKGQGFGYNCDLSQVNRISSGKPFPRTLKSGATLDINGSVTVNSGAHLYATSGTLNASLNTTTNQAKVISSEKTGSITFVDGKAADSTTHQAVQDGTDISYKEIPVENAKLYNGDSSVYSKEIKSGEKIPYTAAQDVWGTLIFEERIGLYYQEDGKIAFYNIKGTFESKTGIFYYDSTVYPCGDNEYYLLSRGYVEIYKGIYRDSSSLSYYFFGQSNTAYRNGSYFIPNADKLGHFFPGSFKFDNKGKLISVVSSGSVSTDMTKYIDDGKLKIDGVIAGIGLFELTDGYIYYAKDDGSIVKNSTCYVSKTNDVQDASNNPIKAGLYWFDAEGHLCDSLMRPIYKGA